MTRRACRASKPNPVRAALGLMTAAALLAGCGSAALQVAARHDGRPGGPGSPVLAGSGGAPAGSRTEALTLARKLLARAVVPAGARRDHRRPLPRLLRQPGQVMGGARDSVDIHEVFWLRQEMPAAYGFLRKNVPAGMRRTGYGQAGDRAGITMDDVTYSPRSLPAGIYAAEQVTAVVPAPRGGSLLRADAQVTWFPRRTAAEHIEPADFRAVTVSATMQKSGPRTVTRTRTFTSPAVVAGLARLLNRLPATPVQVAGCPAMLDMYRVRFIAATASPADVVAVAPGCLGDYISVGGKVQPPLWDAGRLARAVRRLLGIGNGAGARAPAHR
jgi:hypothetical protein